METFGEFVIALFWAAILIVAGYFVGSWLAGLTRASLERSRLDPSVRNLVVSFVRPVVVIIAVVAALDVFEVDLTAVVALLGAAGIAIGLALKDSLSNVASGAMLLTLRPFYTGDFVEVGGVMGTVEAVELFTTTLRTPQGVVVTIPNLTVAKSPIHNFVRSGMRRVDLTVQVPYDVDLGKVDETLRAVIAEQEAVVSDPAPDVRFDSLGDLGVRVLAWAWVPTADFGTTKSALVRRAREALSEAGVEIVTSHAVLPAPRKRA